MKPKLITQPIQQNVDQMQEAQRDRFDTTELYLNWIQVHCLYNIYLQCLKLGKSTKTLDTTEVLAKSMYLTIVNINRDKPFEMCHLL